MSLAHATIACLVLVWAKIATAASAASVPDSAQMSELRRAAAKAPVLLVRGDFGLREVHDPLLDSTGVRSAKWESAWRPRPALITTLGAPSPVTPSPITWDEITSLDTQHPRKLMGTLIGGVTGLAAGMLVLGLSNETAGTGEITKGMALAVGLTSLGITIGFIAGSVTGTRTIYPPQETAK